MAQNGRLSSTKKMQWMENSQESSRAKTCSSYEKKPARTKKIPKKKQRQLLKQVPTRKPARKGKGERGQRGLHLLPGITALLEDDPKNSAKRDGEKQGVGSFGAQGLHHARHPVESRKNGEGLTCPGLSSTKPGVGSGSHHGPSRFPPWVNKKKTIVTCSGLASRRGDDRGGRGGP